MTKMNMNSHNNMLLFSPPISAKIHTYQRNLNKLQSESKYSNLRPQEENYLKLYDDCNY